MMPLMVTCVGLVRKENEMEPCVDCGVMIDADVHAEELGMCLDCSNVYWSHDDEEVDNG